MSLSFKLSPAPACEFLGGFSDDSNNISVDIVLTSVTATWKNTPETFFNKYSGKNRWRHFE